MGHFKKLRERFEKLSREATVRLGKSGFKELNKGSERHGAFEWSWLRERDETRCYVLFGVVEDTPGTYEVDVWAGADDGQHFGRLEIMSPTRDAKDEDIIFALEQAAQRALAMDEKDMPHDKRL